MAYCFKKNEPVADAICRLGRARIEHALECLGRAARRDAIHCARKDIKKVRALLRLVRPQVPKKDFRCQIDLLHEAAAQLAAARDACVKAQTLRNLTAHFEGRLAPAALRSVRAEVRKECREALTQFVKKRNATVAARLLRRESKALESLRVRGDGWKAICPGVRTAYRCGRLGFWAAATDGAPENFHAWRKRAKDLWYQVRLLQPIWSEQLEATANELESLCEHLGTDHDLVVLRQDLEQVSIGRGRKRELETLNGLIEERQRELRAQALTLGERFYADKPSVFCDRLGRYWNIWRREKRGRKSRARQPQPSAAAAAAGST